MKSLRWSAPLIASAALVLSACSGGGTTPNVPGSGLNGVSGAMHSAKDIHFTVQGIRRAAKCNTSNFPAGCFPYSIQNGLQISWCAGNATDPCGQTSDITDWNGNVYVVKSGKQVKGIKVTWSGPFPCTPSTCSVSGPNDTYELDTMVTGKKPPKQTGGKYKDYQPIQGCLSTSSCGELTAIGISVGP